MPEITEGADAMRPEQPKPIVIDVTREFDPEAVLREATAAAMPGLPESLRAEAERDMRRAVELNKPLDDLLKQTFPGLRGMRL